MYYYGQPLHRAPIGPHMHDTGQKSVIKVTGEGMVFTQPDIAIISIGIITENKELQVAQEENRSKTTNVIHALVKLGLSKEEIQTESFRIDMQYDYQDGKQIFQGYRVTHILQITVRQIQKTGQIVDTAVESGANHVSNIQFTIENQAPFYNEALRIAVADAKEKAKTIATSLGSNWNYFPAKVIETTQLQLPQVPPHQAAFALKSEPTPIQPGELKITARLEIEFVYQG